MREKDEVLNVYPDAIFLEDTHCYFGDGPGAKMPYMLCHAISKELKSHCVNNRVVVDWWNWRDKIHLYPLSAFHATEEECWVEAAARVQNIVATILSD